MKDAQLRLNVRPSGVRVGNQGSFQGLWLQTWHGLFFCCPSSVEIPRIRELQSTKLEKENVGATYLNWLTIDL